MDTREHDKLFVEDFEELIDATEEPKTEVVEAVQMKFGKVVDCPKLNIRKAPDAKAQILCVIDRDAEVEIDESESTEYFYKIYLATGAEGFAMKQFIEII